MKKFACLALAALLSLTVLTGCSGSAAAEEKTEDKPIKVALLLPGEVNDGGWNAEAHKGLERLRDEYGAEINYLENVGQSDMQEAMRNYAVEEYDFVIGHGFQFADSAMAVAPEFEKTRFIINSATVNQAPNVGSCNTNNKQQGFLAGVFAGKMTKSGKVGGIASIEIPSLMSFMEGAELGVKYVDSSCDFTSVYTGSSTDVGKAKELSKALVNEGADILLPYASQGDNGVYETAKETGTLCVGVISDHYSDAPDQIPVSIRCDIGEADFTLVKGLASGEIEWEARAYNMGITEGIVGYFDLQGKWPDEIPEDVWKFCKDVEAAFADGTLDIDDVTLDNLDSLPKI